MTNPGPFSITDAVYFTRRFREHLKRNPDQTMFQVTRTEAEMLLAALDFAIEEDGVTMTDCAHTNTKRGKDIPRLYGSFYSEVCKACGAYRYRDHRDVLATGVLGRWRPASEYEADCLDDREDQE